MEGYIHSLLHTLYVVCICACMRLMGLLANPYSTLIRSVTSPESRLIQTLYTLQKIIPLD